MKRGTHHDELPTWNHHVRDCLEEVINLFLSDALTVGRLIIEAIIDHRPARMTTTDLGPVPTTINNASVGKLQHLR